MSKIIKIEDVWKEYRLGVIGYGTLYRDIQKMNSISNLLSLVNPWNL